MLELTNLTIGRGPAQAKPTESQPFKLGPINLSIPRGAYAVLIGPTGSGKTTLLETIAGLCPCQAGNLRLDGTDITHHSPADRHLGYVPQEGVLFPRLTVEENLAFGLRARGVRPTDRITRVAELAEQLRITPLLKRLPKTLSGGEKQRVALGRALATHPDLLLLDEPFAALDTESRQAAYELILSLRNEYEFTTLHVSHQQEDIARLADIVFEIQAGKLQRIKTEKEEE